MPKILFNLEGHPGERLWADLQTGRYLEGPRASSPSGRQSHPYVSRTPLPKEQEDPAFLQTPYGPQGHEEQLAPRAVKALVKAFRRKSSVHADAIDRGLKLLRELEAEGTYQRLDAEAMVVAPSLVMAALHEERVLAVPF